MKEKIHQKIVALYGSSRFFIATLVLFVVETSWIAVSGLYPMAFDERFHLGAIKLYANRWLPFWSAQPPGANYLGAVYRDPSYMYHYLLSFPYRLFAHFIGSQTAQVLFLRGTSILFFVIGLVLFRKVLRMIGASRAVTNTVLLLFILTPIVPFLAAQINYDNLLFPISGLVFIFCLNMIKKRQASDVIDVKSALQLIIWSLFGSLVMFSFLPITVSCFGLIAWQLLQQWRQKGTAKLLKQLGKNFKQISRLARFTLVGLVIIMSGLFIERYGVNTIKYHTPVPDCNQVLNVSSCWDYEPWRRNYQSHESKLQGKITPVASDPINYTARDWYRMMSYQLFFSLNGEASGFKIGEALLLPKVFALVVSLVGLVLIIFYQRYLKRFTGLSFLVAAGAFYVLVLWQREYAAFLYVGYAVAVQVRYLVNYLPILYLLFALAYQRWLQPWPWLKSALALLATGILFFEGGGAMVFILRSDSTWYWPNSFVLRANQFIQRVMRLFVIGA